MGRGLRPKHKMCLRRPFTRFCLLVLGEAHAFRVPAFARSGRSSCCCPGPRRVYMPPAIEPSHSIRPQHHRESPLLFNAQLGEAEVEAETNGRARREPLDEINLTDESPEQDPDDDADEPVCRIIATSDGKISRLPALSALSPSSKSLIEKIELLYSVQSQRELRDLNYMLPRSTPSPTKDPSFRDELSSDPLVYAGEELIGVAKGSIDQEEKIVSILKQSLEDGGFRLMDQRDLDLCSALNAGYLLRLSLVPNVKDLDPRIAKEFYPEIYGENDGGNYGRTGDNVGSALDSSGKPLFDGRVLVFRRGYSEEITTGRLLLPKLDYLQASLVQRSSTALTRKLGAFEQRLEAIIFGFVSRVSNAVLKAYDELVQRCRDFAVELLENFGLMKMELVSSLALKNTTIESDEVSDGITVASRFNASSPDMSYVTRGNRIFKLGRYRTSTSSLIPDSLDLNDALSPFLLCEMGGANASYTVEKDIYDGLEAGMLSCQYDDTVLSIQNSTLGGQAAFGSSYKPAAIHLLERISIQNTVDLFSKKGRRELIRNYVKYSTLVEPAYEEVIVIWRPLRKKKRRTIETIYPPKWLYEVAQVFDMEDRLPKPKNNTKANAIDDGPMPLEIKAFTDVPMANVQAVLPKTKLVFRPADAIVFDLVSVISFLAVAGSLKFDSPRLDLIALISLTFFAVRTFFRYSNKYARYDLLVNKFLTSKLSHRGPGALKYIVSEANANKAMRAMLTRDWLLSGAVSRRADGQLDDPSVKQGKSYVNDRSSSVASQIDVDLASALDELKRLDLIDEQFEVKGESGAQEGLKQLWNDAFDGGNKK
ncbi:hypothetical protein ACHAWF_014841 [Thalassiosira exigua]